MRRAVALGAGVLLAGAGFTSMLGCDPLIEMPRLPVHGTLDSKTSEERLETKSDTVSKSQACGSFVSGDFTIEILSIEKIEGGVQVFVKAWKKGEPQGFGADGSVEIERFRFFNPPLLVPDDNGPIIQEYTSETSGKSFTFRFREDPAEALRQAVADSVEASVRPGKIVSGKVGNTTSTFYPEADPASTAGDARIFYNGAAAYATAQAATDGTGVENSGASAEVNNLTVGTFRVSRFFVAFDTSSIPDTDSISSATLSYFCFDKNDPDSDSLSVVAATPSSVTTYTTADFDQAGTTKLASDITFASMSCASAYNDFALNASGLANITATGVSKFAWRTAKDISATAPSGITYVDGRTADVAGTTEDPKLVVNHAAAVEANNPGKLFRSGGTVIRGTSVIIK